MLICLSLSLSLSLFLSIALSLIGDTPERGADRNTSLADAGAGEPGQAGRRAGEAGRPVQELLQGKSK